jgi:hypothetical protein
VTETIALFGAGGKMGCRIIDHLNGRPEYALRCVETAPAGQANVARRGLPCLPRGEALADAEIVILALPDRVLGRVAHEVVPDARSGALLVTLDPAAICAGDLPRRRDVSYFVTHPCHPSVFEPEDDPAARADFFGGTKAKMPIVCALAQGGEADYARGERLARDFFAPVTRAHRITVEQMALLEPAMAETTGIALIVALREALEEVVSRGVPRPAAEDFLYGHIKVPLGIVFERADFPLSDGAKLIAEFGRRRILRPDWKQVFEPGSVREQLRAILDGRLPE